MCGKVPSSIPERKTTGNSSPLAVCSVIRVTTPPSAPGAPDGMSSASATSETRSRKSSSEMTSPVSIRSSSNSRATSTSSARFSIRVSSWGSELARSSRRYPLCSTTASRSPATPDPSAQTLDSDSSSPVNTSIAATDRVAMPGASAGRPSAATKGMRSRSASWAMQASARSPIPRLGTLMMRRRLTVSAGLRDDAQVGEGVLDLLALVEPGAADDLVGHADPDQHLLERAGLGVGPVEDRDVAGADALGVLQVVDLLRDERRLVVLAVGDVADDLHPVAGVGPEVLGAALLVAGDHRVGGPQDGLRGAVVLLQQDGPRVGVVLLELDDVADRRAAERVDRLVGVADDAQLARRHGVRRASPEAGPTSSLTSWYCATLVSWYSSTRMCRNRRR